MMTYSNFFRQFGIRKSIFLMLLVFYTMPFFVSATGGQAIAEREALWQEFREKNPYNYQTVGLKQFSDGSALIIISEPSESVTIYGLYSVFDDLSIDADIESYTHRMGFDGWVKDVVVAIDHLQDARIDELKNNLFRYLYGTDYKAAFLNLDVIPTHTNFSTTNLNMQISAEELKKWFIDDNEDLLNVDNGKRIKFTDCLELNKEQAVYYTEKTGFVVWVIYRNSIDEEEFKVCARKFSLDADLIYGAISYYNTIAIIGRERSVPVYVLPPMRTETLQLLASTIEKGLSQSYERTNFFAGKLSSYKDYAPIYLSDELWHTEYGSILNNTDQMLKSWSENGTIRYDGFGYPSPIDWAFDIGAHKDLKTSSLTYNWNTAGAGYRIDPDPNNPYAIYAVNRTGSLPVSYIPGETDSISKSDPVYQAEELAYDFFSGLSNPELVKVAQYAIMYQIFSNFDIKIPDKEISYSDIVTSEANEERLTAILNSICAFHDRDNDYYDPIQVEVIDDYYDNLNDKLWDKGCDNLEDSINATIAVNLLKNRLINQIDTVNSYIYDLKEKVVLKDYLQTALEVLDEFGGEISDEAAFLEAVNSRGTPFLSMVSHFMVNPRKKDLSFVQEKAVDEYDSYESSQIIAYILDKYEDRVKVYADILNLYDLDDAKFEYVLENLGKSHTWIKCPSIVQSLVLTEDSLYAEGGHDLNAKITPVKIDETLAAGTCRVEKALDGKKIIYVSSADKSHISPDFLRLVERTDVRGQYSFKKPKLELRQRDAVANVTTKRTSRGFNVPDHLDVVEVNSDGLLMMNGKKIDNCNDLYRELAYNAQNKTGTSPKQIVFKEVSEDMVQTIIDGTHTYTLNRGAEFKIPNSSYNFSKAKFKKNKDGSTLVSVPIEGTGIKAKESEHVFKVPTSKLEAFKEAFMELIKDPKGVWNQFKYKRKMKNLDIRTEDYEDWIKYNKIAIVIDFKTNDIYHVEFMQEEIA